MKRKMHFGFRDGLWYCRYPELWSATGRGRTVAEAYRNYLAIDEYTRF